MARVLSPIFDCPASEQSGLGDPWSGSQTHWTTDHSRGDEHRLGAGRVFAYHCGLFRGFQEFYHCPRRCGLFHRGRLEVPASPRRWLASRGVPA